MRLVKFQKKIRDVTSWKNPTSLIKKTACSTYVFSCSWCCYHIDTALQRHIHKLEFLSRANHLNSGEKSIRPLNTHANKGLKTAKDRLDAPQQGVSQSGTALSLSPTKMTIQSIPLIVSAVGLPKNWHYIRYYYDSEPCRVLREEWSKDIWKRGNRAGFGYSNNFL